MTSLLLLVALVLFVGTRVHQYWEPEQATEVLRRWGAVQSLQIMEQEGAFSESLIEEEKLTGLFDLWKGQWYRIPASAFHHGDWIHLLANSVVIWLLGYLLEPKINAWGYLAFLCLASVVSMLPEFLLENAAIGLSGVGCAQFGMLLILRRWDASIAYWITDRTVQIGLASLVLCIAFTAMDWMAIANVAHFSGLAYGAVTGLVFFEDWKVPRAGRWAFYAAHGLLLPGVYFALHPVWDGRYHWYQAIYEPSAEKKIAHWERAVAWDPGLEKPWFYLAVAYHDEGKFQKAWETCLKGLSYNRSSVPGVKISRTIWSRLESFEQRGEALEALKEVFGEDADEWIQRLGLPKRIPDESQLQIALDVERESEDEPEEKYALDQKIELPVSDGEMQEGRARDLNAPEVDPDDPGSAVEGVTL